VLLELNSQNDARTFPATKYPPQSLKISICWHETAFIPTQVNRAKRL